MSLDYDGSQGDASAAPPAKERSSGKWRWAVYILLTLIFGMATASTEPSSAANVPGEFARSYAEGYARGQVFGAGLGMLLGTYALAAVFLAWSARTRKFIPGTAFCLALLSFVGRLGSLEAAAETDAQFAAMQRWADSLGTAHFAEEDAPPQSTEARMAWASRMAVQDMVEHIQERQRAHGFHPDTVPAAMGTPEYLANARAHPEIREYFTRQQAFLQELDTTEMSVLRDRMEFRVLQSGLRGRVAEEMMEGVRASTDSLPDRWRQRSANHLALAAAALEMHDFLVRVDTRVHLDREANVARFARRSEHNRFVALADEYDRLLAVVQEQRGESRDRLGDVRALFGQPGDSAGQ